MPKPPSLWLLVLTAGQIRLAGGQEGVRRGCSLQVVVDPFLWQENLKEAQQLSQEPQEASRIARYNVQSLVGRLVGQANAVLDSYYLDNVKYKLLLQDIQILREEDECGPLCEADLQVSDLLDLFSYHNRDAYCLSYLLTFRSFQEGKLGLAYTATGHSGGVCERFRPHQEVTFGLERTVNKSLNTGVVSLSRNSRRVSERVAALTMAHEMGHSLGAPHDPPECEEAAGEAGQYLMYRSGSLGTRPNNMKFSPCSIQSMAAALRDLEGRVEAPPCWSLDSGRGTCGNSVVELWEECDCGKDLEECERQCCVPPGDPAGRKPCTLAPGARCSPSEGLCCNSSCEYSPATTACATSTDCSEQAFCTGRNSYCPVSRPLADSTLCAGGSRTCQAGACAGSVCQSLGQLPCSPAPTTNDTAAACRPHCHASDTPCGPVQPAFPDGTECGVGGRYGYCVGGSCEVGGVSSSHAPWVVGLALSLIFYFLLSLCFLWVYCRYCRHSSRRILPGKPAATTSSLSSRELED